MNVWIRKFSSIRTKFNVIYRAIRGHRIVSYVRHESDLPLAADLVRVEQRQVFWRPSLRQLARILFDPPLEGAGYASEARRWLQPVSDSPIATTGPNTVIFNCYDSFSVALIGFVWTTTGTVTKLVMDFNLYRNVHAAGSRTGKMDGTNGVITSPAVGQQAQGMFLYKDLGYDPGEIDINPGNSIQAIVTTTTTAGNGMPFVVGYPRAEDFSNLSGGVASS